MVVTQGGDARGMSHWSLWFGIRRELDTSEHREWISIPNSVVSTFYSKLRVFIPSLGFPDSSVGKESTCNAGDSGLIPGSGRSGEVIDYPFQYSWASLVAQLVMNPPAVQETWVQSLGWEDPWRREKLPIPVFWPEEFQGLCSPWGRRVSNFCFHLITSKGLRDCYWLITIPKKH